MKTINTIIAENIYNNDSIENIVTICKFVAENNGVKAELENNEIFIYGCDAQEIDPSDVRNEMLASLIEEGY